MADIRIKDGDSLTIDIQSGSYRATCTFHCRLDGPTKVWITKPGPNGTQTTFFGRVKGQPADSELERE